MGHTQATPRSHYCLHHGRVHSIKGWSSIIFVNFVACVKFIHKKIIYMVLTLFLVNSQILYPTIISCYTVIVLHKKYCIMFKSYHHIWPRLQLSDLIDGRTFLCHFREFYSIKVRPHPLPWVWWSGCETNIVQCSVTSILT